MKPSKMHRFLSLDLALFFRRGQRFSVPADTWRGPFPFNGRKRRRYLIEITVLFQSIVCRNAPLTTGLRLAASETKNHPFYVLLLALADDIESGFHLHEALKRRPLFFPAQYVARVAAAEQAGNLEQTLDQLRGDLQREERVAMAVRSSARFVLAVYAVLLLVGWYISRSFSPQLDAVLKDFDASVAMPATHDFVTTFCKVTYAGLPTAVWLALIPAAMVFPLFLSQNGRRRVRNAASHVPGLRGILQARDMALTAQFMHPLLASGVPLTEVLDQAVALDVRPALRAALGRVRAAVGLGQPFAHAIQGESAFSPGFRALASMGDASGLLPESLEQEGRIAFDRFHNGILLLNELVFPACVIAMGFLVLQFSMWLFTTLVAFTDALLNSM